MEIRNIAIIAHVDHGKTTLTDALMRQTGMSEEGVTMDTNALEQERGITIYSKNTSVLYKDTKINIVDTPGHADFSSEVERVLRAIDSVILVVDAQEGPMPQTKYVLKKSLELGLKPIVVINKIDKPAARPEVVHEEVLELFMDLGASDLQLNFTTVYAIAKQGIAKLKLSEEAKDLSPLLDVILKEVPCASNEAALTLPVRFQPFNLAYDNYLGRLAIGRVYEGVLKNNSSAYLKKVSGETENGRITKIFTFYGLKKHVVEEAVAGDIVMIAGFPKIDIGETVCESAELEALPAINVDEPTIALDFLVNNSPFAGKEGKFVTNKQLKERLEKELEVNVGLKIDFFSDHYKVYGRGELHIAILLENMRREGYEIQVSQPQVILKKEGDKLYEPFEEVTIDMPSNYTGVVIEKLSQRKGLLKQVKNHGTESRLIFEIPTRGLLGYRGEFIIDTKGEGIICSHFLGFKDHVGLLEKHLVGSMTSMATGKAMGYSLANLQDRGILYIKPGDDIYEGMVVGQTARGDEMKVNPIKGKELTNIRSSTSDIAIHLTTALTLTLERGLEVIKDDEYLEVTPKNIRLRKKYLSEIERVRAKRKHEDLK